MLDPKRVISALVGAVPTTTESGSQHRYSPPVPPAAATAAIVTLLILNVDSANQYHGYRNVFG
jgi:hypothetical protein